MCDKLGRIAGNCVRRFDRARGLRGNWDLMQMHQCCVHGGEVLSHNRLAAFAVGLSNRFFDLRDGFFARQHPANRKEAGLHDGVNAIAHLCFFGNSIGIDRKELDLFVDDCLLNR